jgi:hypothetical protein
MKIRKFIGEIPPPKPKGQPWKYKTPLLEVGEYFDIPEGKLKSVRTSALAYGKKSDKQFVVREMEHGYICIRTA